jgi:hypothetical protein
MADNTAVLEHRQAAVEAQARGDSHAANEAFAAELRALSAKPDISAENLDDTDAREDAASETPVTNTEREDATPGESSVSVSDDTQFQHVEPVPVDITDATYRAFRENFGEDEATSLQRAWGDNALGNERIVGAVIEDHPKLDQIYVEHQTENGALSSDGVVHALRYVLEQSGKDVSSASALAFLKKHPELDNIYYDHADEDGNLSITGLYRALHYIGKATGYKFTYRGKQR